MQFFYIAFYSFMLGLFYITLIFQAFRRRNVFNTYLLFLLKFYYLLVPPLQSFWMTQDPLVSSSSSQLYRMIQAKRSWAATAKRSTLGLVHLAWQAPLQSSLLQLSYRPYRDWSHLKLSECRNCSMQVLILTLFRPAKASQVDVGFRYVQSCSFLNFFSKQRRRARSSNTLWR